VRSRPVDLPSSFRKVSPIIVVMLKLFVDQHRYI